jgi:hypothetical protein
MAEMSASSFVVFPFLKTTHAVELGGFQLRSTDDTTGLSRADAKHLAEIANMLFLQDDQRIPSASYTVVRAIPLFGDKSESDGETLLKLRRLREMIAFCYAAPHETLGEPFMHLEDASVVIFTPAEFPEFLVKPGSGAKSASASEYLSGGANATVSGYHGLYNFKHSLFLIAGSRLYPTIPGIALKLAQNLSSDCALFFSHSSRFASLPKLVDDTLTPARERVATSIEWFNESNSLNSDEESAIVSLAIAFETILGLPREEKAVRVVDAIALLLGRVARLDEWALQFYEARSDIVHTGRATRLRFAVGNRTRNADTMEYRSLLSYGRQIFQLCVATIMFGIDVAVSAGVEEKFVTNQERFEIIARVLGDDNMSSRERLDRIARSVASLAEFQFVSETFFGPEKPLLCARSAARALLDSNVSLDDHLKEAIESLANVDRTDIYAGLAAVRHADTIGTQFRSTGNEDEPAMTVLRLLHIVWRYTFPNYFYLDRKLKEKQSRPQGPVIP